MLSYIYKDFKQNDRWYYIQDGAPDHRSTFAMKWLKRNNMNILNWPAKSSGLNVIESIWDIIDKKLINSHPRTVDNRRQIILL